MVLKDCTHMHTHAHSRSHTQMRISGKTIEVPAYHYQREKLGVQEESAEEGEDEDAQDEQEEIPVF